MAADITEEDLKMVAVFVSEKKYDSIYVSSFKILQEISDMTRLQNSNILEKIDQKQNIKAEVNMRYCVTLNRHSHGSDHIFH